MVGAIFRADVMNMAQLRMRPKAGHVMVCVGVNTREAYLLGKRDQATQSNQNTKNTQSDQNS